MPLFRSRTPEGDASAAPRRGLRVNWVVVLCMAGLLAYGVLFVRSAGSIRVGKPRTLWIDVLRVWIPLGLAAQVALARLDYRKWIDAAAVPWLGTVVLLLLVFVPGIGTTNNMGAHRWIMGLFQPSEFAKVAVVPMLAFVLARAPLSSQQWRLWGALAAAALPAALVLVEPDMGTAIPFAVAAVAMAFVSGVARRTLLALVGAGALAAAVFFGAILLPERLSPENKARVERVTDRVIFPHWKARVLTFVYPERDPRGKGWNLMQSKIAVGSGGRSGKGYMQGTQNLLGYLPWAVSSSDFIFSVIAEETGFEGCALLLLLFGGLVGGVVWTGLACRDATGRLICAGVAAILFTHVFVNVGMTIGVMPITGIPLPLVSYGGTFTVATLAMLGLVQSVALHGPRGDALGMPPP
ncbi:MAG: FtsW/RodA/SpoVE family cell cycle protein [Kiritimatiellae bacterium]|nr:FtsW/RodA/SpoVE family cell cycle protein [Kiritimatiellia bacterium]